MCVGESNIMKYEFSFQVICKIKSHPWWSVHVWVIRMRKFRARQVNFQCHLISWWQSWASNSCFLHFISQCATLPLCISQVTTRMCSSNKLVLNYQELNKIKISHLCEALWATGSPCGLQVLEDCTWDTYGSGLGMAYVIAACNSTGQNAVIGPQSKYRGGWEM